MYRHRPTTRLREAVPTNSTIMDSITTTVWFRSTRPPFAHQHLQYCAGHGCEDISRHLGGGSVAPPPGLDPLEHEQVAIQPQVRHRADPGRGEGVSPVRFGAA